MPDLPEASPPAPLLAVVGGLSAPVSRRTYLAVGVSLMGLKYAVEAGLILALTGKWLSPLVYLTPLVSLRQGLMASAPGWLWIALALWTLPFAWVGATMSVRRARDAGLHPALGLFFFAPVINYLAMIALAALPTRARPPRRGPLVGPERGVAAALVGVAGGAAVATGMAGFSVLVMGSYSAGLFLGAPFVMGAVAGLLYNLRVQHGAGSTALVGLTTTAAAGGLLLLFALEGVICLAMASPILAVTGIVGALVGRELARLEARRALAAPMMALPLLVALEPDVPPAVHMVRTAVEIDAPPEAVWDAVIAFPEIARAPTWTFRLGLAYPVRAWIEGEGVGAVRFCEFSTGAFVEPITVWEPPSELAFDVVDNPPTMHELSPWPRVHAPHIEGGVMESQRGQFRLEALAGGRTRLTGTTWYTFDMAPQLYWTAWSDAIIHRIHLRVLEHIGEVAVAPGSGA